MKRLRARGTLSLEKIESTRTMCTRVYPYPSNPRVWLTYITSRGKPTLPLPGTTVLGPTHGSIYSTPLCYAGSHFSSLLSDYIHITYYREFVSISNKTQHHLYEYIENITQNRKMARLLQRPGRSPSRRCYFPLPERSNRPAPMLLASAYRHELRTIQYGVSAVLLYPTNWTQWSKLPWSCVPHAAPFITPDL